MSSFERARQCSQCPWRRSAPLGKFPIERFAAMQPSVEQGFGVMFACHLSAEVPQACVGWLYNQCVESERGPENFRLRLALSTGLVDPEQLVVTRAQYESFDAMVAANHPGWVRA
jgi:hypothetical protein